LVAKQLVEVELLGVMAGGSARRPALCEPSGFAENLDALTVRAYTWTASPTSPPANSDVHW
jgi:hypothetical protein